MTDKPIKLANADFGYIGTRYSPNNPWAPSDIDKMETPTTDNYPKLVQECRFFYRRDPIASTVLNKLVEIAVTELRIEKGKLSPNEYRIFEGIKDDIEEFIEQCALEYLISGLVVPEIKYAAVTQDKVKELGVKKMSTLYLPVEMWLRDPATMKINWSFLLSKPSYYIKIPDKMIYFLQNHGLYPDGTKDLELYQLMITYYPAFVERVLAGEKEILLENDLILRRRPLTDSPYPTPYLHPAIESLKHKRNIKRLDYSLAARAISAIQQFRVGNDDFPVTEDDEDVFDSLRDQMAWRDSGGRDIERIFQLFTNHTVEIEWIYPPLEALLDDKKYVGVNEDIFFSLGFPRILTTGESQRTGTSDPEFASISPVKTMENMQKKLLLVVKGIIKEVATRNRITEIPRVVFEPISLHKFIDFVQGLRHLYDTGNISRDTYTSAFGYNFEEEVQKRSEENKTMKKLGVEGFSPVPFSNEPGDQTNKDSGQPKKSTPSGGSK